MIGPFRAASFVDVHWRMFRLERSTSARGEPVARTIRQPIKAPSLLLLLCRLAALDDTAALCVRA